MAGDGSVPVLEEARAAVFGLAELDFVAAGFFFTTLGETTGSTGSVVGSPSATAAAAVLRLDSQVALALTLTLHELTTNACKYGALSNDTGVVSLDWQCHEGENDEDVRFSLQWQESGGPTVTPPARTGFGSKMIERSLRSHFRGKSSLKYEPEGVVFSITRRFRRRQSQ